MSRLQVSFSFFPLLDHLTFMSENSKPASRVFGDPPSFSLKYLRKGLFQGLTWDYFMDWLDKYDMG